MDRLAAPHSTASICGMNGTLRRGTAPHDSLAGVNRALFRRQAIAAYVNMDTRGSLLSVGSPSIRWLLVGASAVLLGLVAVVVLGRVRVTAAGRGELRPSERPLPILAPPGAKIRAVRCAVGATVRRGDVLFDLDTSEPERALAECNGRLGRLKESVSAAQRQLDGWLASPAPAEAIAYLLESRVQRSEELLQQEEVRCEALGAQAAATTIASPQDGTVVDVSALAGFPAKEGSTLALVLPASAQLVAYVHVAESEIGRIQEGTPVLLRYDAYPFESFGMGEGHVIRVLDDAPECGPQQTPVASTASPAIPAADDDAVLEVALDQAPATVKVRSGLKFDASVVTGERSIASVVFAQ